MKSAHVKLADLTDWRRGVVATLNEMSGKYMPLYVAEFQFRHNSRSTPDSDCRMSKSFFGNPKDVLKRVRNSVNLSRDNVL